ncbi:hypothetical protein BpHYR1_047874 [Brachionus plicatilis]|uniref:Uncharacterized protein n=1 Tax=Brachionus plicatilis TaxID=10195 RepID=A0A3M7T9W7_BRAPC|nr:hypothetical protein BpHYR1_047874 [Brachionus plicatilis]
MWAPVSAPKSWLTASSSSSSFEEEDDDEDDDESELFEQEHLASDSSDSEDKSDKDEHEVMDEYEPSDALEYRLKFWLKFSSFSSKKSLFLSSLSLRLFIVVGALADGAPHQPFDYGTVVRLLHVFGTIRLFPRTWFSVGPYLDRTPHSARPEQLALIGRLFSGAPVPLRPVSPRLNRQALLAVLVVAVDVLAQIRVKVVIVLVFFFIAAICLAIQIGHFHLVVVIGGGELDLDVLVHRVQVRKVIVELKHCLVLGPGLAVLLAF